MRKTIVKLDLCGSKKFADSLDRIADNSRANLLSRLIDEVRNVFPYASAYYPNGSLYNPEGDAVYVVLDKPTVALRCSVEFQKAWSSFVPSVPDCRVVIEQGDVEQVKYVERVQLIGEPFENISVSEKQYGAGDIGITQNIINHIDGTLVHFRKIGVVTVTPTRELALYRVNYEDPRLLEDSSLAHALFIADPSGQKVRERTLETLILEYFLEHGTDETNLNHINPWLEEKSCPQLTAATIHDLCVKSQYLKCDGAKVYLEPDLRSRLNAIQKDFETERSNAIEFVRGRIARNIGVSEDTLEHETNLRALIEEYLCAVFLEIRMMANYFRSTASLFERLYESSEFDYILKQAYKTEKIEQFVFFKRAFLEALKSLATSNNKYVASIFHNVLMLYYLNRNTRLAQGELRALREKQIYIDTNTLYAYRCEASVFHEIIAFALDRLKKLGASICLFDKSLEEYNSSLESALHRYRNDKGATYVWQGKYRPWIWSEYARAPGTYHHKFEFCVARHRIPRSDKPVEQMDFEGASKDLSRFGITLMRLSPYKNMQELGEIYNYVFTAKDKPDRYAPLYNQAPEDDFFHKMVLHDANCLDFLQHAGATDPHSSKRLFVTCDFALSKVRRR
jgi:hypothetical protein